MKTILLPVIIASSYHYKNLGLDSSAQKGIPVAFAPIVNLGLVNLHTGKPEPLPRLVKVPSQE